MSPTFKSEYLQTVKNRYKNSSKSEKQTILDEFCKVCGYNRKYAIRLLNSKARPKAKRNKKKQGRKSQYDDPLILKVLKQFWVKTNLPCSKRLKAIILLWLPHYEFALPQAIKNKLLSISPATIDRLMAPIRRKLQIRGTATTKPGSILKKHIPIKTNQWNEKEPGFVEADTVAHCGSSTEGMFVYTINCVDIATSWTEQRAAWGKGEKGVIDAIKSMERTFPFPLKGFDCDNGSEFLNWHLYRYFIERKQPVQFTRARAYHKNDNAHIEGKNWTHIRQYLGYQRFDKYELVEMLNELYTSQWNLYFNFFIPSVKLIEKQRIGSKIIKKYDKPKTPYQRIIESEALCNVTKNRLKDLFLTLNPFELEKKMTRKIKMIIKKVNSVEL